MTKIDKKIIAIAILFGLFVGIFDAILDTLFFYEAPFWDLLLFDIPNHELYIRSLIFVMFFIFGIISSLILNQLKIEKQEVINSRRSLQTISQINQAVMHATEEKELLKDICQIIIDSGYKLAWVGYLSQDIEKRVLPVAYAGFEEGYLESLNITWADTDRGRGPTGTAIRTGKPNIVRNIRSDPNFNPWRNNAIKRGYVSSSAFPLTIEKKTFGTLNIIAAEPEAFDTEEIKRLTDAANDLAFGIMMIRSRLERDRLEREFRYERGNFRSILNSVEDGVYIVNRLYDIEFINSAFTREFGPVAGRKCYDYFFDRLDPCPWCKNKEVFAGKTIRGEITSVKNNRIYNLIDTPLNNPDGSISKLQISRDLTELKRNIESYQMLFESSPVGIGLSDFNGKVLTCNNSMCEITGYTLEEMQEIELSSTYVNPSDQKFLRKLLTEEGKVRNYEVKLKRKTGEIYNASLSIDIIELDDQEVYQIVQQDVTEQKQVEMALKKEKDTVQKYLDIVGVIIVVLDKEQKITLINKKGCKLLGYEEKEILGKNWFDNYLPLRLRKDVKAVYDQLMAGEVEFVEYYKNPILTRNNEERTIAWYNSLLYDENNKIIGTLSSGEDITELKKAEDALKLVNRAVQQSVNMVVITDPEGIIEYINPKFSEVTGYALEEIIGQHTRILKSGEQSEEYYQSLWHTITEGKDWRGEFKNKRKDGGYYWDESSISPVRNVKGEIINFIAIKEDITEHKQMREALRESEEKYRNLAERAQDGIMLVQDNLLIYINPALGQMLGYTSEEMLYTPFTDYFHPDRLVEAIDRHEKQLAGQKIKPVNESVLVKKDGKSLDIELNAGLISFQNKPANLVIIRDITERKSVEAERSELEQKREHFITMTTHELRTPLTIFRGYVELLQRIGEDFPPQKRNVVLEKMQYSCNRLENLISKAGDFTKIERGLFQVSPTLFNLDVFLQKVVETPNELLKDQFLYDSSCIETSIQIMGDTDRLRQIIGNLIENASHHTSELTRKIVLSTEVLPDKLRIILSDNGAGIASENLEKIFDQFVTLPTDFHVGGTGVGLYISRKIAEAHQGSLIAESDGLGKGARFILELPR